MFKRLCAFLFLLLLRFHGQRDCCQAFLAYQIGMLQRRLGNKKLIPSKAERESLLALGAKCDHEVDELLEVVSPETYRRWLRKSSVGKEPGQVGRKPISGEVLDLIRQFKRENPDWGLRRILGELKGYWTKPLRAIGVFT